MMEHLSSPVIMALVFLFLGILPLILTGFRYGIFSPLFLTGSYLIVGVLIRGLLIAGEAGGELILAPWVLENDLDTRLWVGLVDFGIISLCIFFGFALALQYIRKRDALRLTAMFRTPTLSDLGILKIAIVGISASIVFFLFLVLGGDSLEATLVDLQTRAQTALSRSNYFVSVIPSIVVVSALIVYQNSVQRAKEGSTSRYRWVVILLSFLAIGVFISMGARGAVLQYFLMLLIVRFAVMGNRLNIPDVRLILLILSVGLVLTLGLALRESAQRNQSVRESLRVVREDLVRTLSNPFSILDSYLLSKEYVREEGLDLGGELLLFFTRPIPRSVMPSKPQLLGLRIRQMFWGDQVGGIPPSIFGEFYIALGYAGIVSGSLLYGAFLAVLHRIYSLSFLRPNRAIVYALLASGMIMTSIRSGAEIGLINTIIILSVLALMRAIAPRMKREFVRS